MISFTSPICSVHSLKVTNGNLIFQSLWSAKLRIFLCKLDFSTIFLQNTEGYDTEEYVGQELIRAWVVFAVLTCWLKIKLILSFLIKYQNQYCANFWNLYYIFWRVRTPQVGIDSPTSGVVITRIIISALQESSIGVLTFVR